MNAIAIKTWSELDEQIYHGAWNAQLARWRPSTVYRGESVVDKPLASSLNRLQTSEDVEEHLIRNFRKYARQDTTLHDSPWMWLAIGQHHGLPTRLLDWTHSPQVAFHFMTADTERMDEDGVIWCMDYTKTNAYLPTQLTRQLQAEGSDVFTLEMLEESANNLKEWDALAQEPFVVFWEPPSLDQRMVNQFAVFSLLSRPSMALDAWLAKHPECYRLLRVSATLKWEIRDKLDQANITERILFPGLDGLSRWLKRYYSPRNRSQ